MSMQAVAVSPFFIAHNETGRLPTPPLAAA